MNHEYIGIIVEEALDDNLLINKLAIDKVILQITKTGRIDGICTR